MVVGLMVMLIHYFDKILVSDDDTTAERAERNSQESWADPRHQCMPPKHRECYMLIAYWFRIIHMSWNKNQLLSEISYYAGWW